MAKVTMRPNYTKANTAEKEAPAIASKADETVDSRGRVLRIKAPTALEKMRLMAVLGNQLSKNEMYFGFAVLASHVTHIDGEPCERMLSQRVLEAKVDQLGDDGLNAVAKFLAPEAEIDENPEA